MAHVFKNFRDETRKGFGVNISESESLTGDQVTLGCLLRIADSTELIARNYEKLLKEVEYWQARCRSATAERDSLRKSNAALRGQITKLKNKKPEE